MKHYIIIFPIFFISFIIISFYIFRNAEIKNNIKDLAAIQNTSYELEILTQKQKIFLDNLDTEINYDDIVHIDKQFQEKLLYLMKAIESLDDVNLKDDIRNIKFKNNNLNYIHENIKADNAIVKNSLIWLKKGYVNYLENKNTDKELLKYLFYVINSKNKTVDLKNISPTVFQANNLNQHLQVINNKRKSLINLNKELEINDLLGEFEKVISYTSKSITELQSETESIIKILLISIIFLIFFAFIVYLKELATSRKALKLKNELQQFVDALNESSIVSKTDLKGRITYANKKFCEVSGYSHDELMGQKHNIIRHPDMPQSVFLDLWTTIKNKKVFKATIKNRKKNGDSYFVNTTIIPILDINGEIEEYLAVRYDVNELVESRDKAIFAEKIKGEFLSNMSHELRTPLNAINGFSSILSRLIKDEKQLSYLKNIMESSNNLIGLINDILDLSKLQSGKFILDYQGFNLKNSMETCLSSFNVLLDKSDLVMNRDIDSSLDIRLSGDWLRISQIVTNLVSNAIKFTPRGKEIDFIVKYDDSNLIIEVKDRGIGMNKDEQNKIFKPFEQADSSITRKYGGTGLGLSIVINLVKQMKGEIKLQSKEREGSTFKVILPLQKIKQIEKEDSVSEKEDEEYKPLNGNILIAEDNKTNQMLVSILMEEFGLDFKVANDGNEAVEMFGKEKFDLVLMDENMPNMNGIDAMREIYFLYGKEVPMIALTANAMVGDKERFLEAGMRAYVSKPIDDKVLYKEIAKLLKK